MPVSMAQQSPPVCVDPIVSDPRPLWRELAKSVGGSDYPDYQNVTNNLQVLNSIKLLASIATRAAEKLQDLSSDVEDPEAEGRCVCCVGLSSKCTPPEFYLNVKRKDCTAKQCNGLEGSNYPIWLPTDLFKDEKETVLFALKLIGFLDDLKEILAKIKSKDKTSALVEALEKLGSTLENIEELITKFQKYVDLLTEGYHLGGYSTERSDLHLCVGYGGHGAYTEMLKLFGEVSIGSRYTSHNLTRVDRARFQSGGFAVDAFGRTLSILPGIEANLQIDGFKMWNVQKPFGIEFPNVGDCSCPHGCGFPLNAIQKYDIFHLVDQKDVSSFDTSGDGCIQPGEFLIKGFYPAKYRSGTNNNLYTWPRLPVEQFDWEKQNTAVFGAGLNFSPRLKRIEKYIPPSGIPLFTGVTLFPKLTLDAGADWKYEANGLRDRLKDSINKSLPTNLQLTATSFDRPMHFLQAPDVSEDDTSSAFVRPRIAADLLVGIKLAKFLTLGITASIGTSVRVEPAGHGGVHDLNVALTEALLKSNPPPNLPCDPIIEEKETKRCSNELFLDSMGKPLSSRTYSCDTTEEVVYHCKEPEQDRTCKPASAEQDCPKTKECVPKYGCSAYGYCARQSPAGGPEQVQHDTTLAACEGLKVCLEPAINRGQKCKQDTDCPGPNMCVSGPNTGQRCMTDRDCGVIVQAAQAPRVCRPTTAPCAVPVPFFEPGYFTPYQCLTETKPEITGWQGPGCHPLTVGFPSACGCTNDNDCANGEKCVGGKCSLPDNKPVQCDCDPGNDKCGQGRKCVEGACLLTCTSDADCGANQTCKNNVCVNPSTTYNNQTYTIPFAEQLVYQVTHTPKPQHAVASYALSDILTSVILDAGLRFGLDLRIFRKNYHFDILKLSDYWTLAAFNKSWYQAGLEARYQNDCDPVPNTMLDKTVTNWQPGDQRVNRYPTSLPGTGSFGNAGTEAGLRQWCLDKLPTDVKNPDAPGEGNLATTVTDIVEWGEKIGVDMWGLGGMCVSTELRPGAVTEQPFTEWVKNLNTSPPNPFCSYTYNNQTYTFPCSDLRKQLLQIWGCLDVNANPFAGILASAFPGIVTTFQNRLVLNLDAMLIDKDAEFTLENLNPAIRNYMVGFGPPQGVLWYSAVSQCWDAREAQVKPEDVKLLGVDIHPCCGNGKLETSGCGQEGGTPCEQCDDGNQKAGDGCSPVCRIEVEAKPLGCGNGILEVGLGEQCDDGNKIPGDGCEPDCTRTPVSQLPNLMITKTASPNPVSPGSSVTYTITITNKGGSAASNVVVTDNLPANTTFVSCTATGGGVCGGSGNNRTVTFSSLAANASATITLVARANCAGPDATPITNTASVSSTPPDSTPH